ncbi:unnamed protein product [Adineta steineri]|uniref:G-protein coupled receptors family 1 profile domain-containing protein n=1 Tax=Adineta steineri TaxID=433720 RepID=A0A813NU76_9BILA|nr:unnamed protein product [Adineta steineri]CAF3771785.1 unnamed protein product [Adineta steineri]
MSNLVAQVFHIAIYIQPIHFILAIITNILNISVLYSHTLRKSPCTYYFLAYAVFSIIYSCLLCPTQILRSFSINWINGVFNCKISTYLLYLIPFQANLMLNLASFDRYCSSSQSYARRSLSARRKVNIIIIISTILLSLYMLPMIFIYNWDITNSICVVKSNILISIYLFSQISLYYILSPLLLIVFGFLTISNIRQQTARIAPSRTVRHGRRTEKQLARMLLLQVSVHLIFALPFGVTYTINSFQPSTQTLTIIGLRLIFVMWQQCDYFVSFFLYIFSGSIYRRQSIRLLKSILCLNIFSST